MPTSVRIPFTEASTGRKAELLREFLSYDYDDGILRWRVHVGARATKGRIAGSPDRHGHLHIRLGGKRYAAHRLIWLYVTGEWPPLDIDHQDRNPASNRWSNLRLATKSQNLHNMSQRKKKRNGTLKGAYYNKKSDRWYSMIMVRRKNIYLGYFRTEEAAHAAYTQAATKYCGEFACGG